MKSQLLVHIYWYLGSTHKGADGLLIICFLFSDETSARDKSNCY